MEQSATTAHTSNFATAHENGRSSLCIGVVGLGNMGAAFARNLVSNGYRTIVFDRNKSKRDACSGAQPVDAIRDLSPCDLIFTSLPNDEVILALCEGENGLLAAMKRGAIHISTSTISPTAARRLSLLHEQRGQGYVASPVLGNPDLAAAAKVFFMVGGPVTQVDQVIPVLDKLGQHVFAMGDDPGHANLMKLAANVMIATTLQSVGETLALLRKGGIDAELGFEVLTNSLFDSKVHKTYGGKILKEHYRPAGMVVPLALKDMRLALTEAEHTATPMPFTSIVRDRMVAMMARGWEELDWSALGLLASQDARLPSAPELSDVVILHDQYA